jgi:hypothetical protein
MVVRQSVVGMVRDDVLVKLDRLGVVFEAQIRIGGNVTNLVSSGTLPGDARRRDCASTEYKRDYGRNEERRYGPDSGHQGKPTQEFDQAFRKPMTEENRGFAGKSDFCT